MKPLKSLKHRAIYAVLSVILFHEAVVYGVDSISPGAERGQARLREHVEKKEGSTVIKGENDNGIVTTSTDDVRCDPTWHGIAPSAAYEIVFTTREALSQMGIDRHHGSVDTAFRNQARIPSVYDMFDTKTVEAYEHSLNAQGYVLQTAEQVVLTSAQGTFIDCGICAAEAVYSFVQLLSVDEDDEGPTAYHFAPLHYPSWKFQPILISVPPTSMAIPKNVELTVDAVGILACVSPGHQPVFFLNPLQTGSQAPVFRKGPFDEPVEVVRVQAFRSLQPDTFVLEATLPIRRNTPVAAHVMREGTNLVYFATVTGPPILQSAMVLGSFTANPECSLKRNTPTGAVRLHCETWDSLVKRTADRWLHRRQQKSRKSWIIGGFLGAAALVSLGLLVRGCTHDIRRGVGLWNFIRGRIPERPRERFGVVNPSGVSGHMNPYNIAAAAGVSLASIGLGGRAARTAVRVSGLTHAARGILLRGGGLHGAAATSIVAGLIGIYYGIRGAKRQITQRRTQQQLNRGVGGMIKAVKVPKKSNPEQLKAGILFVVLH
ncbi:putative transmembrane protein [Toxoplasma gondii GAB2-2007-GAL-DOM2]|uniref:Transmembrane protein n=10 Tax=Toxoplasma gondii TaxID=5811 RepID=A0A125YGU0_TOXGG|nr:hypothetical protein TGGT1_299780 [Toxoplasma gondii GT1]ESS28396.1 putative transmembrane protein [Toxoplasma gondii VEG]KAF4638139.1 hypothetical protein TGRH88_057470 [Toxoplasma gondii]KFG28732.1 putative transmembrane protein [Toxoplasma gondii p89]KFG34536.1 putative transmembrane protein [Toxoplasma gondii FOU]KFG47882.1 putative transmembrane protein [Toxoplasma gondii GAB2-2007-GAL-DOM2]KFG99619.1 putative transmembrane protein [Toxoplasma gondii VAND]KFH04442.1 putative transmem